MYNPNQFRETRAEVLQAFIAQHPLGALVAMSSDAAYFLATYWKEHGKTTDASRLLDTVLQLARNSLQK